MKIKKILILIGPPGSGKGTQGKLLAPIYNYNYLSMGSTLRDYAKSTHPKAAEIKALIDSGHIIPDTLIHKIFFATIKELPKADGLILDGFPRDYHQVGILDELLVKYNVDEVRVVFIDVPKVKVLGRLKKRGGLESRKDDDINVIETRFKEYDAKTHPLVDYFTKQHRLVRINGDQTVEQVHTEILKKLEHG